MTTKAESITDLNLLSCPKCGTPIITVGENKQLYIPHFNFKCLDCDASGTFDRVVADTGAKHELHTKRKDTN